MPKQNLPHNCIFDWAFPADFFHTNIYRHEVNILQNSTPAHIQAVGFQISCTAIHILVYHKANSNTWVVQEKSFKSQGPHYINKTLKF